MPTVTLSLTDKHYHRLEKAFGRIKKGRLKIVGFSKWFREHADDLLPLTEKDQLELDYINWSKRLAYAEDMRLKIENKIKEYNQKTFVEVENVLN